MTKSMQIPVWAEGSLVSVFNDRNEMILVLPVQAANNSTVTAGGVKFARKTGYKVSNQFSGNAMTYEPVTTREKKPSVSLKLVATRVEMFDPEQLQQTETEKSFVLTRAVNCNGSFDTISKAVSDHLAQYGLADASAYDLRILKNSISFKAVVMDKETPEQFIERTYRAPKLRQLEMGRSYWQRKKAKAESEQIAA